MGKTQSKRSVDITTESKKTTEEEVTGKLEKIEDVDQRKQGNGDASSQDCNEPEKKIEIDESENDKDLTTEKCVESQELNENQGPNNTVTSDDTKDNDEENANPDEEISPLSDESLKKSKKEKVKKKWSFRNISFGKKDKQKPVKSDETTEEIMANGETEKPVLRDLKVDKNVDTEGDNVTSESNINDEGKSTTTEKADKVVADINIPTTEDASESSITAIEKQTENVDKTAESTDILSTESNKKSDVTINTPTGNETSKCINEVFTCKAIKTESDGCDDEKPEENVITEQLNNLHIEVNTDKASEEHFKLDPVSNINEEKLVDDVNNGLSEFNNMNKICGENLESSVQNGSYPPPLPHSPPPSQVSVFALSDSTQSATATSKVVLNLMAIGPSQITEERSFENTEIQLENDNHKEITYPVDMSKRTENMIEDDPLVNQHLLDSSLNISDDVLLKSSHLDVVSEYNNTNRITTEDPKSQIEELIAATVVKEITETAVEIIEKHLCEDQPNYVQKNIGEEQDENTREDLIVTNKKKDTFSNLHSDIQAEPENLQENGDCTLNKIVELSSNEDEVTPYIEISKDISEEGNASEGITHELSTACE